MTFGRAALASTILALLAWGCSPAPQTLLVVSVDKDPEAPLPEYLLINVLRGGNPTVTDLRVPASGVLSKLANPIATVQITLDGDVSTPRDLQISAVSQGIVISKVEQLGVTTNAMNAVELQLTLSPIGSDIAPLPIKPDASAVDPGPSTTPPTVDAGASPPQDAAPIVPDAAVVKMDAAKLAPDTAPPLPTNLVTNGGFESGATQWKTVNGNVAAVSAGPSSAFALRSDTAGAWCQQDIRGFATSKTYVLKATGKGDIAGCTVGVVMGNDSNGEIQRNTADAFGTTWTTKTKDFVVPSAATWMFVFIHNNGSPACWTDDVSITLN
jgi:hypothetical protein